MMDYWVNFFSPNKVRSINYSINFSPTAMGVNIALVNDPQGICLGNLVGRNYHF